jgi:hypothetical protein
VWARLPAGKEEAAYADPMAVGGPFDAPLGRTRGHPKSWRQEVNTRTIALIALIIAVIVLVILLT